MNSLVFELVGPAGVGKTAVLHAISRLAPAVRTGLRIDRIRQLPVIAWSMVALTPAMAEMMIVDSRQLWPGVRHLGRLRSLSTELARARTHAPDEPILLDEGPVFSLGRLSVFQHAAEGTGLLGRQWRSEVARWSRLLDGIIVLDARNEILAERIRQRPKPHEVKASSDREVFAFLDRYRDAYRDLVARLTASGQVQTVEFDTGTTPVEAIAAGVLTALDGWGVRSGVVAANRGT